jgi:enediyne biosynthesis protein E4
VLAFLFAGVIIWGGWAWWMGWRYRTAMEGIRSDVATGRFTIAAHNLVKVLAWKPDSDEAAYLLGTCEQARGRNQAAGDAWARVVPGSEFWDRAILGRLRLFHESGRLASAEQLINDMAEDPRNERTAVLLMLVPLESEQGRLDEAERLIETRWEHLNEIGEGALEPAIKLVQLHIELTLKATPVETLRAFLERSVGLAPADDRVWLGQANLAIRVGAYEAAERLLDACLKRRPQDVPVWRARLSWGLATDRVDVVQEALSHLPFAESIPAQLHRLNAWLAFKRGDVETERRELERLLAADPADLNAFDRLAQLAQKDGQPARAAELLRKKVEIDRLRARYEKLYDRKQPVRDAVEMARLAEQLGRGFEARALLTLAISEDPDREDLRRDLKRLSQSPGPLANRWQTLAELLADERRKVGKIDGRPLSEYRSINFEGKVPLLRFSNYDTGLDDLFSTPPRASSNS